MIELAEHAEAYVREQQRDGGGPHDRGPNRNHNTRQAEREWAQQFQ